MSHDPSQFGLVIGSLNGTPIDEHEATRKREGGNRLVVDAVKFPGILVAKRVQVVDQPMAYLGEIGIELWVVTERILFLRLHGKLLAHFDVLLGGE